MHSYSPYKITVAIPTYNRSQNLLKSVASIIDQGVPGVLIHIFDNCSSDNTRDVVGELMATHPNIRYTRRERNIGSLANYSDALRSMATPYFIPLADDDWLLPRSIAPLLHEMEEDSTLGVAIARTRHEGIDGEYLGMNPGSGWDYTRMEPPRILDMWMRLGHFEWSSGLFRTSAVKTLNLPDISTGNCWDVDFQMQLFEKFPVKILNFTAAVFLIHPNQSHRETPLSKFQEIFLLIDKSYKVNQTSKEAHDIFVRRWISEIARICSSYHKKHAIKIAIKIAGRKNGIPNLIRFTRSFCIHQLRILKSGIIRKSQNKLSDRD